MNKSAIAKIVIWSVVAVLSLVILVFGIIDDGISFGYISTYYDNEELYAICYGEEEIPNEISAVEINWVNGNIDVKIHDGDNLIIREHGYTDEDSRLRYHVDERGQLTIQSRKSKRLVSDKDIPTKNLVVLVPADDAASLSSLDITDIDGRITVEGVQSRNVSLEVVSAEIYMYDVIASKLDVESVSADVDIDGSFDSVSLENVSGNAKIKSAVCPREIDTELVSGDLTLYIPEGSGFCVELDAVSGSFLSTFDYKKRGDEYTVGNGGASFSIETVSGNVTIKKITE